MKSKLEIGNWKLGAPTWRTAVPIGATICFFLVAILLLTMACHKQVIQAQYPTASQREVALFEASRYNAVAASSINAFEQSIEQLHKAGVIDLQTGEALIRKSAEAAIVDRQAVEVLRSAQELDPASAEKVMGLYNQILLLFSRATLETELAGIKSEETRQKIVGVANIVTQVVSQAVGQLKDYEVLK